MFVPDRLAGRHVLVTGGGTGLGRAISRRLLDLGASQNDTATLLGWTDAQWDAVRPSR